MQKLILVSILVITIAVPAAAAGEPDARRALRNTLSWTVVGILLYTLCVVFIYPRFPS